MQKTPNLFVRIIFVHMKKKMFSWINNSVDLKINLVVGNRAQVKNIFIASCKINMKEKEKKKRNEND